MKLEWGNEEIHLKPYVAIEILNNMRNHTTDTYKREALSMAIDAIQNVNEDQK